MTCRIQGNMIKSKTPHKLFNSGYSLLEIIIATAIVSILAKIAYSNYAEYEEKARIYQAVTDIAGIGSQLESYWNENRTYPDSLSQIGLGNKLDPWGNPYQYLKLSGPSTIGAARKDRNLVPINSDFDLYSRGKDNSSRPPLAVPVSQDDIIRANNGRFIDLASKY